MIKSKIEFVIGIPFTFIVEHRELQLPAAELVQEPTPGACHGPDAVGAQTSPPSTAVPYPVLPDCEHIWAFTPDPPAPMSIGGALAGPPPPPGSQSLYPTLFVLPLGLFFWLSSIVTPAESNCHCLICPLKLSECHLH